MFVAAVIAKVAAGLKCGTAGRAKTNGAVRGVPFKLLSLSRDFGASGAIFLIAVPLNDLDAAKGTNQANHLLS